MFSSGAPAGGFDAVDSGDLRRRPHHGSSEHAVADRPGPGWRPVVRELGRITNIRSVFLNGYASEPKRCSLANTVLS
jgi:hypothetical protein